MTEKSFRKDFITKISKILEHHGMILFDDPSLSYVDRKDNKKRTHFPDIVVANKERVSTEGEHISIAKDGVVAVIETKKASRYVYEGFAQATRYMATLNTNIAFSTNFKDVVGVQIIDSKPKIDEHLNTKLTETAMASVVDFIVDVITKSKELQPIELSDDLIVKILSGSVSEILDFMKGVESKELEEPLGFFFAKTLDTELMKSSKSKKDFEFSIKKGAAYLIVNQIVFYHILSKEASSDYDHLEEVESAAELQKYFDRVLEDDYRSIFGAKVTKFLPAKSMEAINSIINAVNVLGLENVKHDILGKIFHGLIPQELRKRIAAYYTSNAAAELLAELCIDNKDAKVFDPACGSGTLLVASYKRKRELYGKATEDVHRKLLNQIFGGDISLFAAHLASIHLALQEPLSYTEEVHILLGDFFDVSPKKNLVDWLGQNKTVKKVNAQHIRDVQFNLPYMDLIIMNPPFTRMELLEKKYKEFIEKTFQRNNLEQYTQGRMGLHSLFLIHSDNFLRPGSKIAAVLPASTFYTGYGEKLNQFLLSRYNIKYIITSDVETAFSEQCTFKEILFVAEKKLDKKPIKTLFISLKVPLNLKNAKDIAKRVRHLEENHEDSVLRARAVSPKELAEENNWMVFTDDSSDLYDKISKLKNLVMGEKYLDGNISEGIRRFPIDFFYLPNSLWEIKEETQHGLKICHVHTKEELFIEKRLLSSSIRKPEMYKTIQLKPSHYLLSIHPNEKINKDLQRYISLAEKLGMDKQSSTLVKTVQKEKVPWYSYTHLLKRNPKIFGNVFVVDKLRVNTGKIMAHYLPQKVTASGMFHVISLNSDEEAKILALWYNSTVHMFLFLFRGREIQGGYYRALISDLKRLPIIDTSKLETNIRKKLIRIFDEYKNKEPPSFPKQIEESFKKEPDLAILEALGASNPEKLLTTLYKNVYDKIEKLRTESY